MKSFVVKIFDCVRRAIWWRLLIFSLLIAGCKVKLPSSESSAPNSQAISGSETASLTADTYFSENAFGFGQGTTGGKGAEVVIVTNLSDSGDGSLRGFLEDPRPMIVKFRSGLKGIIYLSSSINMKSNKTVEGLGSDITISPLNPNSPETAIKISDQSNIIISNLRFEGRTENWDRDREGADGINIKNSTKIWIHHCHFRRWIDGGIDIVPGKSGGISSDISVTSNRFEDIYQGLLLTTKRLTFARNYCIRVRTRCVKIIKGEVHSFNNILEDWGSDDIQYAKDGGQLLSEENIFSPKKSNRINREENGHIQMLGNRLKSGVKVSKSSKVSVSFLNETRNAPIIRCRSDANCWTNLESDLKSDAGNRSISARGLSGLGN